MTLKELHERIGWQLEGRLQHRKGMACDGPEWFDWSANSHSTPVLSDRADFYRRRPDTPAMPDDVWLPESSFTTDLPAHCGPKPDTLYGLKPIRYVRAGAVIPASHLQWRNIVTTGTSDWKNQSEAAVIEYRIKP